MTHSHLLHRCQQSRRAKAALRLRARQLRAAATFGGALMLGAIAVPEPAQAATVTIDTAVNGTQFIGGGDDLVIEASGSITATNPDEDGVRESAPGASIGSISNAGSITATDSGIGASTGATVGDISNSGSISADFGVNLFSATVNGNITNSGSIEGGLVGISAVSSTINGAIQNQAGGTVSGSDFSGIQVAGGSVSGGTTGLRAENDGQGAMAISTDAVQGVTGDAISVYTGTSSTTLTPLALTPPPARRSA